MADETTEQKAESALNDALDNGQSHTMGDISESKTPASAAYAILKQERERSAMADGRRHLFRGIDLGSM